MVTCRKCFRINNVSFSPTMVSISFSAEPVNPWKIEQKHTKKQGQLQNVKSKESEKIRIVSTALLLNEVSEKSREIWNEVSEIFSEIFSEIRPGIRFESFRAHLAGRKVLPPNFTRFSHRRIQISNRIRNQISPKTSQTHFCRLGSPKGLEGQSKPKGAYFTRVRVSESSQFSGYAAVLRN